MKRVATEHFKCEASQITKYGDGLEVIEVYNVDNKTNTLVYALYTFQKLGDENIYAVYLNGTTPYVAYADSVNVHQSKMEAINKQIDLERFFTKDQWIRLSPLIREDEFTDGNVLLNGLESEQQRLEIYEELLDLASKELKTLSQPSLEFSMDMANILAIPEFEPLFNQFQLGNFVRVSIRPDYVKRARLLEVQLNFDDLSDFNCTFGNLITVKSEIDLHAELLKQAVTAGKQVAASAGNWQKAVDKSNKLEEEIANGLQNSALEIGKANGQSITWNEQGIRCKKLIDGTTDQYEDNQIAIINNKIVMTNDNWKTSKAALGEFVVNIDGENQTMYGLLADAVVSGYIQGSTIKGGSLEVGGEGGKFCVNEDGSVQILGPDGSDAYASKTTVETIENATRYRIELTYDNPTLFSTLGCETKITCHVYSFEQEITVFLLNKNVCFNWKRFSNSETQDAEWNKSHSWDNTHSYKHPDGTSETLLANEIIITNDDVPKNAQFYCELTFDKTIFE